MLSSLVLLLVITSCTDAEQERPVDLRLEQWEWHVAYEAAITECMKTKGFEYEAPDLARPDLEVEQAEQFDTVLKLEVMSVFAAGRSGMAEQQSSEVETGQEGDELSPQYFRDLDGEVSDDGEVRPGCRQDAAVEVGPFPELGAQFPVDEDEQINEREQELLSSTKYMEWRESLDSCIASTGYTRSYEYFEEEMISEAALQVAIATDINALDEAENQLTREIDEIWRQCGEEFDEYESWYRDQLGI